MSYQPSTEPRIITTCAEMRQLVRAAQRQGEQVGIVPTMGALHAGHLSLVAAANARCQRTVVTIFVNPTQFLPGEDFEKYPRTLTDDLQALTAYQVDWIFAPSVEEMYGGAGATASTTIDVPALTGRLEGHFRPGHFAGVCTVVMKLFQIAPADFAFFGQKDYQQCRAIETMCRELNLPVEIVACPTIREVDGLAMSSRNRYLAADQRQQALALSRGLDWAKSQVASGARDATELIAELRRQIQTAGPEVRIDYVAIAEPNTLAPLNVIQRTAVVLLAAYIGDTRLIDNCLIEIANSE